MGPFGTFTFPSRPHERRFLFVAGGTGIAPVRSMLKHIEIAGIPGRARLLYSDRTPADFPYLRELRGLVRQGRLELSLTATREVGTQVAWRAGAHRREPARAARRSSRHALLRLRADAMLDDVPLMLMGLGIAKNRILIEEW